MRHVRSSVRLLIVLTSLVLAATALVPRPSYDRPSRSLDYAVQPAFAFLGDGAPPQLTATSPKRSDAATPVGNPRSRLAGTAEKLVKKPAEKTAETTGPDPAIVSSSAGEVSKLTRARALLAAEIRKQPILTGTTIEIGYAQGHQAVSYYRSGRIVVSPTHTASLERIVAHEIWHVIDWRDNGRIDWGESLPPMNASKYYTGPR